MNEKKINFLKKKILLYIETFKKFFIFIIERTEKHLYYNKHAKLF